MGRTHKMLIRIENREDPHQTTVKTCLRRPLKKKTKIGFQDRLSLNAGQKYCRMLPLEHSAILSTFIKLPFVIKIFVIKIFFYSDIVLSIFEWPLKTGFTVLLQKQSDWVCAVCLGFFGRQLVFKILEHLLYITYTFTM